MAIPNPQPQLDIPLDVATGLAKGLFTQHGSIVRWAAGASESRGGQIYKHLPDTRLDKPVEAVVKRAAAVSPKVLLPIVLVGGTALGVTIGWLAKQRVAHNHYVTSVILVFETSLRAYVAAAQTGVLDSAIVERLVIDLDALQALSSDGETIQVSLDDLVPLFELVIAHTSELASAYSFQLDELDTKGGVVVSLRHHLEAQKSILDKAS